MSTKAIWVFEPGMFVDTRSAYEKAVRSLGHVVEDWDPDWWINGRWPRHEGEAVVFRGSLGDAHCVCAELSWRPGALNVPARSSAMARLHSL